MKLHQLLNDSQKKTVQRYSAFLELYLITIIVLHNQSFINLINLFFQNLFQWVRVIRTLHYFDSSINKMSILLCRYYQHTMQMQKIKGVMIKLFQHLLSFIVRSLYVESSFEKLEFFQIGLHSLFRVRFQCQTCGDVLRLLHPQFVCDVFFLQSTGESGQRGLVWCLQHYFMHAVQLRQILLSVRVTVVQMNGCSGRVTGLRYNRS